MYKKIGIGIVVAAILAVTMFAGCVEKEEAPEAAYPTPTQTPTLTPTPTPTQKPTLSVEEIKNTAVVIPYDDLFRNNENHVGKIVYFRGNIVQIGDSDNNRYILRVATKNGYDDVIWVNYEGERLMEDDIIDVWGEVKGLRTYEAVLGNAVTVPEIDSLHVELVAKPVTTLTPKPTPAYSKGDVIGIDTLKYSDTAKFVYDYDEEQDEYRIGEIHRIYGIYIHTGSSFNWRARKYVERDYPNKYDTVDFSEVMDYDEYLASEYRTWMDGYVLPIEEKDRESWYEILKFSGDKWDEGRTKPFAIKGDQGSIKGKISGDIRCWVYVYSEDETAKSKIFLWSKNPLDREFLFSDGNYYLEIDTEEGYDTWETGEWEVIVMDYY